MNILEEVTILFLHILHIMIFSFLDDDDFLKTSSLIMTWLERGDLTKRNVNVFYSILQSLNSHVRRLLNEKQQQEEELQKTKERFKQIFQGILHQCKFMCESFVL